MESTTNLECPNCKQVLMVPTNKHVTFTCPNCSNEFEIDTRIKPKSGSLSSWLYSFVILVILFIGYDYFLKDYFSSSGQTNIVRNNNTSGENKTENIEDKQLSALVAAVDVSNDVTNDFAVKLASYFPGEYNVGQICQIYDYVVKNWKYVNDSDKKEIFRSASRTINNNLSGDCDDFAILMAALVESIGGDARISFAFNEKEGHAFTEVLAANNQEDMELILAQIRQLYNREDFEFVYYKEADGRCWLNLDWFGNPQYPGNKYFEFKHRTVFYPCVAQPTYVKE